MPVTHRRLFGSPQQADLSGAPQPYIEADDEHGDDQNRGEHRLADPYRGAPLILLPNYGRSGAHMSRYVRGGRPPGRPAGLLRRQDPRQGSRHPHQRRHTRSHRPALAGGHQPTGHRAGLYRRITARHQVGIQPDTDDSRRAIVRADSPDSWSASRTTVRSPR
jgi:hypothetical protein